MRHLDAHSATYAAEHPRAAGWDLHAYMLADVFDAVNAASYAVACSTHGSRPRKPKRYKRPTGGRSIKIGRDPIKAKDFFTWFEGRVTKNGR